MNKPRILTASIAAFLALPSIVSATDRNWITNPGDGIWTNAANWDANGVPVSGVGDNIFIHTTGSVAGVALDANWMVLAVGTSGVPASGYTFGAGTYNVGTIHIGEGHTGTTINNNYGRAFIDAGTTINVGAFHLGEWDGASGHVVQSGGDINVSHQFRLGHWPQAGGAQNSYTMNGGTITMTGPNGGTAEGATGNVILGIDSSGAFTMNAGTFTAHGITMQTRGAAGGQSFYNMNGGLLNLGVNGFVTSDPGNAGTYDIQLGGGTIRSTAAWNSNLEMHLVAGTGVHLDGNGFDTTLSGALNGAGSLTKDGAGTLTISSAPTYSGGTTVNAGVLSLTGVSGGGDGNARGTVTVNEGAQLLASNNGGGAAFGYNNGAKVDVLNINGGFVESLGGDNHIWNATVNMTGGELRGNGAVSDAAGAAYQWTNTPLNTFASADTAIISGRLNLRADNSNKLIATVADGAATRDLLVTAAITHNGVGIYKLGPGHMELTGGAATNTIRAVGGELTLSGAGTYTAGSITVGENDVLSGVAGTGAGTLNFKDTIVVSTGSMSMGENWGGAFQTNTVNHSGGDVTITGDSGEGVSFRLGHWPDNTSTYNLSGGTLSMTSPIGGLGIATDGTGIFNQTGGTLNTRIVVVNHRNGGGNATFTLQGGTANIGAGGIVTAGGPAAVNLGGLGGTLAASASWSSSLNATLSGGGASAISFDTTGGSITMSGALSGGGGLNKINAGTLLLAGANSYSGGTSVTGGTLAIGHATGLGSGDVTVSAATLNLAGKGVATTDSAVGAITLSGGTLNFGINGASSDRLSGSSVITLSGVSTVNLIGVGGAAPGTYTLLSGTSFAGAGSLALGTTPAGFFTWTPNQTATTYEVIAAGAPVPLVAYWKGSVSSVWADASAAPLSNWRTDAGGLTDTNQLPGAVSDVFFAASGAGSLTTNTLGADFSIQSLTLTAATGAATVGGANALTIGSGGIVREAGAGAFTVEMASLILGTSATFASNDGAQPLTINAPLSGPGALSTGGGGTVVLNGNNSGYTPAITVGAGTLKLGSANSAGASAGSLIVNGTLDLNGNAVSKGDLSGSGTITTSIAGAASLNASSGTFAGVIQDGGGSMSLVKNGGGNLTLTGANTYSGGTTINGGYLVIGNGTPTGALGSGTTILNGGLVFAKLGASTINGDVNPSGPAGALLLVADGVVTLASGTDIKVNAFETGINGQNDTFGGMLVVGPGTSLVVQNNFTLGNTAGGGAESHGILNQTGGTVDVNGSGDGRNFVLGHWGTGRGTYDLSGGTLNAPNISMAISWDGNGTFNLSGSGVANVRGLRFGHNGGRSGVFNLTGGELNLGTEGIWEENTGLPNDINLGGGTVRAAVNTNIYLPTELTGTNGDVIFDTNGNTLTVSGAITGSGGFTKEGAGRMVLNAANTATGIFTVNAGTLAAIGAHTTNRIPANGIVQINNGGTFEIASPNAVASTANYFVAAGGTLTNGAGVDHVHIGAVQLSGGTWTTDPAAASYNGENYQLHGTVAVGGFTPSLITQQGGTTADRGISWLGPVTFDIADVTGDGAADLIVSTELENGDSGAAQLVKAGFGTMNLTFPNSYSGGTSVDAGTLLVNNATGSGTGSGNVTVAAGATLGGAGTVGDGVAVWASISGKLAPGNSPGTLTFALGTGTLDLTNAATTGFGSFEFELGTASDLVLLTSGSLNIGTGVLEFDDFAFTQLGGFANGDYLLFDSTVGIVGGLGANVSGSLGGGYTGTLEFTDGTNDLRLHVVPEPGSAMLLLGGLGALLGLRRRRK